MQLNKDTHCNVYRGKKILIEFTDGSISYWGGSQGSKVSIKYSINNIWTYILQSRDVNIF